MDNDPVVLVLMEPGLVPLPLWRPGVDGQQWLPGAFHRVVGGAGRN